MLLFVLLSCAADTDACAVDVVEIADDAPAGDLAYTAADIVAAVGGVHEGVVRRPNTNATVLATLTIARGDGAAVLHDATAIEGAERPHYLSRCDDELTVPVTGTLSVTDLGVDVAFATRAGAGLPALDEVLLGASLPVDTPGLPSPPDAATEARLDLVFAAGERPEIRLFWIGPNLSSEIVASLLGPVPAPE